MAGWWGLSGSKFNDPSCYLTVAKSQNVVISIRNLSSYCVSLNTTAGSIDSVFEQLSVLLCAEHLLFSAIISTYQKKISLLFFFSYLKVSASLLLIYYLYCKNEQVFFSLKVLARLHCLRTEQKTSDTIFAAKIRIWKICKHGPPPKKFPGKLDKKLYKRKWATQIQFSVYV